MNFTLKQLRYIESAARLKSIANAAAELNISQSSISAAIDNFEEMLGYSIFVRMPSKGIQTTPAGKDVLALIDGLLDSARHFENDLAAIAGDTTGNLRLACYGTAAPHVMPAILKRYRDLYPQVRVDMREGHMAQLMEMLAKGEVDLALTYSTTISEEVSFKQLFEAWPYAMIPKTHPLAASQEVSLTDLAELPLILLDLPFAREYYLGLFEEAGRVPEIAHSTQSAEIIRSLVGAGFGFSILNIRSPADLPGASDYVHRPIVEIVDPQPFGVSYLSPKGLPKMVEAFLEVCDQMVRENAFERLIVAKGTASPKK